MVSGRGQVLVDRRPHLCDQCFGQRSADQTRDKIKLKKSLGKKKVLAKKSSRENKKLEQKEKVQAKRKCSSENISRSMEIIFVGDGWMQKKK